jgi:hypothetical protein
MQTYGLDYTETFAPVVSFKTVKTILSLSTSRKYHIHHLDIDSAFLHGVLTEKVYMEPPEGVVTGSENTVLLLQKGLYRLKQAPRIWYSKLSQFLPTLNVNKRNEKKSD